MDSRDSNKGCPTSETTSVPPQLPKNCFAFALLGSTGDLVRRGGHVVSMCFFCSDDMSSNTAEDYSFITDIEKNENNRKRGPVMAQFKKKKMISCGQSYKASTSVNYDSTVVITSKLLIFTTLDS